MKDILSDAATRMDKTLSNLDEELGGLRTGRASTTLLDRIRVDYYGNPTPLSQVATVSVPEARLIVIQPWDKNLLGDIEKAIQKSELSLNPNNDGKVLRINIPPLTDERRRDLVKVAKDLAEQARVAVRNIRRDANDSLKKAVKAGDLSEDDEKRETDEVQKLTDRHVAAINEAMERKEAEILEQ
jgi:ribosome recycling factor